MKFIRNNFQNIQPMLKTTKAFNILRQLFGFKFQTKLGLNFSEPPNYLSIFKFINNFFYSLSK